MKKKNHIHILYIFIIIMFSACNNASKGNDNIIPDATKNMEYNQSTPEVSSPQDSKNQPSPQPAEKPSPPPKNTKKKRASNSTPLASYSTNLINKDKGRIHNIRLGAKRINGYKLKPNDTFSFNSIVGNRSIENGFKSATIIVNGEYDEGVGGGVCQLSTTIYNAADKAGLEIVERHDHSRPVNYVPKGRDAAVNYGDKDLKFKNTKQYPIRIQVYVNNKIIYVAIWKSK